MNRPQGEVRHHGPRPIARCTKGRRPPAGRAGTPRAVSDRWSSRRRRRRTIPACSSPWAAWRRRCSSGGRSSTRPCAGWPCRPPASRIGCSWCIDYGYYEGMHGGIDPAKVRAVSTWRTSELFDDRERAVLEYAETATGVPGRGLRRAGRPDPGPPRVMRSSSSSPPGWPWRTSGRASTPGWACAARASRTRARSRCVPSGESPLPDLEADAAAFEEWRPLLFGIAYRMLGSAADAEDVVQDAGVRWLRRGDEPVHSVRAYLVTIVTRLCLDQLDSSRAKRVTYAGPWLPEPVVVDEDLRRPSRRTRCRSPSWCSSRSSRRSSVRPTSSTTSSATPSTRWPARSVALPPPAASSVLGPASTSRNAASASMPTCAMVVS